MRLTSALAATCALLLLGGCGGDGDDSGQSGGDANTTTGAAQPDLPRGSEPVDLDPADFTRRVDNPYWPMAPAGKPGTRWVYRSSDERITVTVTNRRKTVEGIEALVVRDTVTGRDGALVEIMDDWYAQDSEGNVWYLGEDTKEYENGKVVSTAGAWESGVDGAEAGIIMPADPRVGLSYRQEYYEGEAEDAGRVLSLDESVNVPFGRFQNALKTEDTTPLEPNLVEHKYYARNVGPVLRETASGGGREELVDYRRAE